MFPVVLTMISNWFPENELGRANGLVMMFAPLGGIFTAPISGAIIQMLDWRWLFIIEGLLSAVILLFWCYFISDRPEEARWLPQAEKDYLISQLKQERKQKQNPPTVNSANLKDVFKNKGLVSLILLNFFYQTGDYGFTLWLPSILKNLTGSDMSSIGMLSMAPFIAMLVGIYVVTLLSDRKGKRRLWIRISLLCFAASLLVAVQLNEHKIIACIALICCGFFVKAATGPMWSTPSRLASAEVAGNARGVINGLGNLGGFCGPWLVGLMLTYFNQSVAISILAGSLVIAALISFSLPAECDLTPVENQG
jgi:sugar phosphate permease